MPRKTLNYLTRLGDPTETRMVRKVPGALRRAASGPNIPAVRPSGLPVRAVNLPPARIPFATGATPPPIPIQPVVSGPTLNVGAGARAALTGAETAATAGEAAATAAETAATGTRAAGMAGRLGKIGGVLRRFGSAANEARKYKGLGLKQIPKGGAAILGAEMLAKYVGVPAVSEANHANITPQNPMLGGMTMGDARQYIADNNIDPTKENLRPLTGENITQWKERQPGYLRRVAGQSASMVGDSVRGFGSTVMEKGLGPAVAAPFKSTAADVKTGLGMIGDVIVRPQPEVAATDPAPPDVAEQPPFSLPPPGARRAAAAPLTPQQQHMANLEQQTLVRAQQSRDSGVLRQAASIQAGREAEKQAAAEKAASDREKESTLQAAQQTFAMAAEKQRAEALYKMLQDEVSTGVAVDPKDPEKGNRPMTAEEMQARYMEMAQVLGLVDPQQAQVQAAMAEKARRQAVETAPSGAEPSAQEVAAIQEKARRDAAEWRLRKREALNLAANS